MLFNSAIFIAAFLPIVLAGFMVFAGRGHHRLASAWLTLASLVFYGWWNPAYVPLLVGSMAFNYLVGRRLQAQPSRWLLFAGIAANVLLLVYYKYTGFLVDTGNAVLGLDWTIDRIVLPLAISFYTFQQIAYLSDAHDGAVDPHGPLEYALFITFFPQLIAGPITHQKEMIAQFRDPSTFRIRPDNLALGTTVFLLGLFKKVVFADPLGAKASPVFDAAAVGVAPGLVEAWTASLAYTLQIYFDFSGYSDMAVGLALLFGVRLPPNFDSPFKARNVVEYWSRWHMTLTRFLTAYIYNPIVLRVTRARVAAGKPQPRRGRMSVGTFVAMVAYPTLFTMFVSGVWHGAGWQFAVFGLLHGFYLVVAHGWRACKVKQGWPVDSEVVWRRASAVLLTFLCVVVAMVFFRAADVHSALSVLAGMVGINPDRVVHDPMIVAFQPTVRHVVSAVLRSDFTHIGGLLAFVWLLPNTQQWMGNFRTLIDWRPREHWLLQRFSFAAWRPSPMVGAAMGAVGFVALAIAFSEAPTEFLYFQF